MLLFSALGGCGPIEDHLGRPADPADAAEVEFEVPKGSTARALAGPLRRADLIRDPEDFLLWLKLTGEGDCVKAGRFHLRRNMDARQIVDTLCGVPLPEDVPFTVVEGWRIRDVDPELAKAGLGKEGDYASAATASNGVHVDFPLPADSLEGFLFPETYLVVPDRYSAGDLVRRQVETFGERFWTPCQQDEACRATVERRGLGPVVVLASMIEREEPTPANRPLVAGILWKRLDSGWNLGVDATSHYSLPEWNDRLGLLRNLRDPADPYNTRLRGGLPPTPIGNPGLDSLHAAAAPLESEYWYYLHDASRTLHPAKSGAEHERNRATYGVY